VSWLDTIVTAYPGWSLVGLLLVLSGTGTFLFRVWNRAMRCLNIRKHGWPPPHCDADGDFRPPPKTSATNR
jgi:hypothetical protein